MDLSTRACYVGAMRYQEIVGQVWTGKPFLTEMPQIIPDTDFGMSNEEHRQQYAKMLMSLSPQRTIEDTSTYELARGGSGNRVYFFMLEKPKARLVYFAKCDLANAKFIGSIVIQVALWRDDTSLAVRGVTERVFNMLLHEWPTVMSDEQQTGNGRSFWVRRLAEAAGHGYRIGLADMAAQTVDWRPSDEPYPEWIAERRTAWTDQAAAQNLRFVISRS